MNKPESVNLASSLSLRPLVNFPLWIHVFAWGGILALMLLLIGVSQCYAGRKFWGDRTESRELQHPIYTERVYIDDFFRTQANTWSNLAYVLVGFYALGLGCHDLRSKRPNGDGYLINTPAMSLLFGVACCYLGWGSGLFHASLTRWGQQLDVAGMYSPLLVLLAINMGRWFPCLQLRGRQEGFPTWPILSSLVLVASLLLYQYKWSMNSGMVLPAFILSVAAFALLDQITAHRKMATRWLALSAVALVAARFCWQLDLSGKFGGPDAWLQGHAVWHLLTGLSLAAAYAYYHSESLVNPKPPGSISSPSEPEHS